MKNKRDELKRRYLEAMANLIDRAFEGEPQPFLFCDDHCLELYLDGDELKWRPYSG